MKRSYFIILLSLLISCKESSDTGKNISYKRINGVLNKIEYYEDYPKKVFSKTPLNKDSLPNGVELFYFQNGEDSLIRNWLDGKPVGAQITYYQNRKVAKYQFVSLDKIVLYERCFDFDNKSVISEINELGTMNIIEVYKYKEMKNFNAKIFLISPPKVNMSPSFFLAKGKDTIELHFTVRENYLIIDEFISDTSYSEFIINLDITDSLKSIHWIEQNISDLNKMYSPK